MDLHERATIVLRVRKTGACNRALGRSGTRHPLSNCPRQFSTIFNRTKQRAERGPSVCATRAAASDGPPQCARLKDKCHNVSERARSGVFKRVNLFVLVVSSSSRCPLVTPSSFCAKLRPSAEYYFRYFSSLVFRN